MMNVTIRNATRTIVVCLLLAGCTKTTSGESETGTAEPAVTVPPADTDAERPTLTRAECEAKGGRIVGDIGDGAIHRPDYTCEGGQPPIGSIKPAEGEPIATEGEVCCPGA